MCSRSSQFSKTVCESAFCGRFGLCHCFELLILHSSSWRGFKLLMLLFGSMCMNIWIIECLLFNSIGHHLTCISMIRQTSTHTNHLKHMQAHKLYSLLYICHTDMLEIIGWAELLDYNYLYYYGISYLHSQIIMW